MFFGKARVIFGYNEKPHYFTRKSRRFIIQYHSCNPGKKNKQCYNRQVRNGKNKLRELKNSQWKKLSCADKWKWC